MKPLILALAASVLVAAPAAAESLADTHELVWHPAGKTPSAIYRMRDRQPCSATAGGHHQAGKTPMRAPRVCEPIAAARDVDAAPQAGTGALSHAN